VDGEPHLWLEDEGGKVDVVAGEELVTRIREMRQRPRLVVLASCQSAGQGDSETRSDDRGALAALGPRLAEAGIPAVLAMQGNVTMQTVAEFMPVFFRELQRDGQIDRAVSVARGAVRERPDWWVPVRALPRAGVDWKSGRPYCAISGRGAARPSWALA
jgi:CHAT domain-containing protein